MALNTTYRQYVLPPCSNCKRPDSLMEDMKQGQIVCTKCGLVAEDGLVSEEQEWRNFEADSSSRGVDRSRVGGGESALTARHALGTAIGDVRGSGASVASLRRAQAADEEHRHLRRLQEGHESVRRIGTSLGLPNTLIEHAKEIYGRADDSGKLRSFPKASIAAACIFLAAKKLGPAQTLDEVIAHSGESKKKVRTCLKRMHKENLYQTGGKKMSGPMHKKLIVRYCSDLKLPHPVVRVAEHIAVVANKLSIEGVAGKKSATVAGAVILLACAVHPEFRRKVKGEQIAPIARVSASTIDSTFNTLVKYADELLDPDESITPNMPGYIDKGLL